MKRFFALEIQVLVISNRIYDMDAETIARIEPTFDCTLPKDYKRLMLGFPESLEKMLSVEPDPQCRRIFNDAATIIATNKFLRDPERRANPNFFDYQGKYFAIGSDIGGNFYCVDTKRKRSLIYFWFHEDGDFELCAKTINDFIRKVFEDEAEIAVDKLNFVHLE